MSRPPTPITLYAVRRAVFASLILLLASPLTARQDQNGSGGTAAAPQHAVEQEAINPSLPAPEDTPNLETPLACVEHFMLRAREGDFASAAHALNFRLLEGVSPREAATAAERFFYVINQELWIDWESLPDRTDGVDDSTGLGSAGPLVGEKRRSIGLGSIALDGRTVPLRIQRVTAPDAEPVWLFSAQTVDNIRLLYEHHGPSWLEGLMPDWARVRGPWRVAWWQWITLLVTLAVAPLIGYAAGATAGRILRGVKCVDQRLLGIVKWPVIVAVAAGIVYLVLKSVLTLPSAIAGVVDPIALIAFVAAITWLVMRALNYGVDRVARSAIHRVHAEETEEERRLLMQMTVARHVVLLTVALVGIGVVLVQLDLARALGVTLLTSAGAAAIVLGIAGHAVLGNLVAGLEIALSQPFKPGDVVCVEGNWGKIEEIGYTQVIVCTWDERRLVFPIRYFVTNWFENWSLKDPFLIKPIYLHLDYRAPVDAVREKFFELARADDDWDEERAFCEVLVTEFTDETMTVRCTAGGSTVGGAWRMSCRIRERMMAWLREYDDGRYLPRQRVLLPEDDPRPAHDQAPPATG